MAEEEELRRRPSFFSVLSLSLHDWQTDRTAEDAASDAVDAGTASFPRSLASRTPAGGPR